MSFAKFFKDALLPVAVWACGVLLSCFVLTVAGASTSIVVVAVGVSFIFGMLGIVIEYARRRRFLRQLERAAEELESPAWVQEMVQCPTYAEGELEYEVLRRVGKAACDEVAEGRRQTDDYRDYIESWVHEAKLPLAAAHLILETLMAAKTTCRVWMTWAASWLAWSAISTRRCTTRARKSWSATT